MSLFVPDLNIGGAEKVFVNLANFLVSRGVDVDLVVMNDKGLLKSGLDKRVVYVYLLLKPTNNAMLLFFCSVLGIYRYLKTNSPSVLISSVFGANLAAIVGGKLANLSTPIVIRESSSLRNYGVVKKLIMRIVFPFATHIIAVSERGSEELRGYLSGVESKVEVIGNGVNINEISSLAMAPLDTKTSYGKYIVAVGRLIDAKGFDVLISAFGKIAYAHQEINLVILGDGELRSDLESLVSDSGLNGRVFLPGFKSNPYPYIKQAELFVLSSRWEGFPNVLVEAMCLGVNIVSTNCKYGPEEVLTNEMEERLVPVDDTDALSKAMIDALTRVDYSVLDERYNNDYVFEKYLKFIQ